MRLEKIYKKEDGTKYKVHVSLTSNWSSDDVRWSVCVDICAPGKRKFIGLVDETDYRYRCLTMEDRKEYMYRVYREHGLVDWIRETQMELVEHIKNSINDLIL